MSNYFRNSPAAIPPIRPGVVTSVMSQTIEVAGIYALFASVQWPESSAGLRNLVVRVDEAVVAQDTRWADGGNALTQHCATVTPVPQGAVVEVICYHSAANPQVVRVSNAGTWLAGYMVS